eukprot:756757-Hanusia_phi.AAC.1
MAESLTTLPRSRNLVESEEGAKLSVSKVEGGTRHGSQEGDGGGGRGRRRGRTRGILVEEYRTRRN